MRVVFNKLNSVNNPNSIHGIYPYRGKISSKEASSIVSQLPKGSTLLDPFSGSGTIVYEGLINGLNVIGIDNNPLAYWLAKGKIGSLEKNKTDYIEEASSYIEQAKDVTLETSKYPELLSKHFHEKSAHEILRLKMFYEDMSDYLKAVFLGAVALTARGCNDYKWTSSTVGKDINPKRYIPFFEKFLYKVKKHYKNYPIETKHTLVLGDTRKLTTYLPEKSVDFVFTSPPYFNCLDYTAYYGKIIYDLFGQNRSEIRGSLIQNVKDYEDDMRTSLTEIVKVTKDDGLIIFVVGDKKISGTIINGGEYFSNLLHHEPNQILEREYTNSSSQVFDKLNNTKRKEQIVIWDKSTWN